MTRKELRDYAVKLIYQASMNNEYTLDRFKRNFFLLSNEEMTDDYIVNIINNFLDHKFIIDDLIEKNLKNWTIDRINKVELAILRLAVTEMNYIDDIPEVVSINEAVEFAKKYGDDNAPKYINGVLASILKEND